MSTPLSFKEYISYVDDEKSSKTKKKLNKKSPKGRHYGGVPGDQSGMADGGMGESALPTIWSKKFMNLKPEENEETSYEDQEDELGLEDELGDEEDMGLEDEMGMDDEMDLEPEEPEDPNRMGVIRKVKGAHLVYKRQDEEGTYEELWIYKVNGEVKDELEIRRDILAGTDIPQNKMKSEDGTQQYDLWTSGNVQWLNITGLPN